MERKKETVDKSNLFVKVRDGKYIPADLKSHYGIDTLFPTKKQTEILKKLKDKYPPKNGSRRTVDEWMRIAEEHGKLYYKFTHSKNRKGVRKNG
jgi:hypothetical protein